MVMCLKRIEKNNAIDALEKALEAHAAAYQAGGWGALSPYAQKLHELDEIAFRSARAPKGGKQARLLRGYQEVRRRFF